MVGLDFTSHRYVQNNRKLSIDIQARETPFFTLFLYIFLFFLAARESLMKVFFLVLY